MLEKGKKITLEPGKIIEINNVEFDYKNGYLLIELPSSNPNDLAKGIIGR
jgi:hypothetical protein